MTKKLYIRCPKCYHEPNGRDLWICDVCKTRWNTFSTAGKCPTCGKVYETAVCPTRSGGCGQMSPHEDWYETIEPGQETNESRGFFGFWKIAPPVTSNDKLWIEQSMLLFTEVIGTSFFKSLTTIDPDAFLKGFDLAEGENKAVFVLNKLASIMNIDTWEMQLMFYSDNPISFSEGITTTPSAALKDSWSGSTSKLVDNGLGQKELWIDLQLLQNADKLVVAIGYELALYKIKGDYGIEQDAKLLADLICIVFGLGIFKGNAYFKFSQWTGNSHQGWQMQKNGYLPEQIIAYAMAWLAYYRQEDTSWKIKLNRTMRKYFDKSEKYIVRKSNEILWPADMF